MSLPDKQQLMDEARRLFPDPGTFSWNLVSTRRTQLAYFDWMLGHPVWKGRKILDFGGNVGTFLESAADDVRPEDYWCIDLNAAVVEQGRLIHPRAHFIHFNRYGPQYNPQGIRNLPIPDCGVKFDVILAFSVFTHVDLYEMVELVGSLRSMLAPDGVLAFTFFEPAYDRSLSDPRLPPGSTILRHLLPPGESEIESELPKGAQWGVVIDGRLHVDPGDRLCHQTREGKPLESYCSFFSAELMLSLFPGATVHAPVYWEWQHCCVLRNA